MAVGNIINQVEAMQLAAQVQQAFLSSQLAPFDALISHDADFHLVEHQQQAVIAGTRSIGLAKQPLA